MPESYNENAHNQSYLCVCLGCITKYVKYVLIYTNKKPIHVIITFSLTSVFINILYIYSSSPPSLYIS